MPYQITGTLKLPDGSAASNIDIEFISQQNYSPLVRDLSNVIRTGNDGRYSINLEYGEYAVRLIYGNANPLYPGKVFVFADTPAGQDLPSLMQAANFTPATPEYIVQIQGWLLEAAAHEAASSSSESNAKASELAAKSSELAVEADRSEVASNTATVVAAQSDVATKASQVSLDAASALASKNTAVAAADTASQKAESAAAHDASAQDAATRAEQAANVVVGALLDAGPYDASTGVLPAPITGGTIKRSSIWKVTVGGVAGGISLGVGDSLVYTSSDDSYYKIDNTESVSSVNGDTGVVVLTAQKVGADAAGTASALLSQHASQAGAHQISGVSGLSDALTGKEQAGVAASLVQQHAAQSGAHQIGGVLGLQSALDAKYSPSNKPTAGDIGAEVAGAVAAHSEMVGAHQISGVAGLREELDAKADAQGAYNHDNILGPVSFGGSGNPSGAIIESGENANGRYVKWADGTMRATMFKDVTGVSSSQFGSIHVVGSIPVTFPVSFAKTPVVSPVSQSAPNVFSWCAANSASRTGANIVLMCSAAFSSSASVRIGITVDGVWR